MSKTFPTINNAQYKLIEEFWDEMTKHYKLEELLGIGYKWTPGTIEYAIALKSGILPWYNKVIELPDNGWKKVTGKTVDLSNIYTEIYNRHESLKYEIEKFDSLGNCEIIYIV